ncbi:MAG: cation-translocating P-type ATPase [Anaerolineae bacterium]|nr:cation-translocating P-type ATPase [Anaerolineae bacterium]
MTVETEKLMERGAVMHEKDLDHRIYRVEGLSCTDCAARIEAGLARLDGVDEVVVDVAAGTVSLRVANPDVDVSQLERIVEDTGHRLIVDHQRSQAPAGALGFGRFLLGARDTRMTALAAALTILGLGIQLVGLPLAFHSGALLLAILIGGVPVARHALQEIWVARSLGISSLMVVAVVGAIIIGEVAEAAIVVVLFSLGEALEGFAAERARGALDALLDLAPPVALLIGPDGNAVEVPVATLSVGDAIRVRPGDRVSVDGVVTAGHSAVEQAAITGESMPADKGPGDAVYAGTVNTFGALEVEVTRRSEDNTLSQMVALVREAQSRQAPVQRFIDRFARVYTPTVAVVALLVAVVPPLVFAQPFWGDRGWLMRALQMLVIACPCALVISTPVTVVSALTHAATRGVLIKGGRTLEMLGRVRVVAFDKTGTLTEGRPVVTDELRVCADNSRAHNGLSYAAAVEQHSAHPLARALVAEAALQAVDIHASGDVSVLSGRGITGQVDGRRVTVASHGFFDESIPHSEAICMDADRLAAQGKTVMLVCHDDDVCSIFAVADTPRPESVGAVAKLRAAGLRTMMLTGDGSAVATSIGAVVGVDEVRAELLPEDKVAVVREIMDAGQVIAMVGDGVNDAPALAQASVGIAMGGAGSQQAMETADVVLMGNDLGQLPFLLRLGRRTRRTIEANIVVALGIKALVFVLAASGIATLWMAIVADVGASLAVILNGMRLRRA